MRVFVHIVGWTTLLVAVVYFTVGSEDGLFFRNPLAAVGVGLIGLGLCIDFRGRHAAGAVEQLTDGS